MMHYAKDSPLSSDMRTGRPGRVSAEKPRAEVAQAKALLERHCRLLFESVRLGA
jgi:hypothetical protein